MNTSLLWLVAGIYMCVSVQFALQGQKGNALAWFSYSIANVGFALAARGW